MPVTVVLLSIFYRWGPRHKDVKPFSSKCRHSGGSAWFLKPQLSPQRVEKGSPREGEGTLETVGREELRRVTSQSTKAGIRSLLAYQRLWELWKNQENLTHMEKAINRGSHRRTHVEKTINRCSHDLSSGEIIWFHIQLW